MTFFNNFQRIVYIWGTLELVTLMIIALRPRTLLLITLLFLDDIVTVYSDIDLYIDYLPTSKYLDEIQLKMIISFFLLLRSGQLERQNEWNDSSSHHYLLFGDFFDLSLSWIGNGLDHSSWKS